MKISLDEYVKTSSKENKVLHKKVWDNIEQRYVYIIGYWYSFTDFITCTNSNYQETKVYENELIRKMEDLYIDIIKE